MKTLLNILFFSFAFAGALGSVRLANGFSRGLELPEISASARKPATKSKIQAVPKDFKVSVISEDQARSLFQEFAANKSIPFKYAPDGCYARATEMALIAEKKGIIAGKVYAEGKLQAKLDGNPNFPSVNWGWHVAPVISVKTKDGTNEVRVFDPSLFTRPVTVEEWKQKMMDTSNGFKPEVKELYFGTRFEYYNNDYDSYKAKWDPNTLKSSKETMALYLEFQNHPESDVLSRLAGISKYPDSEEDDQGADQNGFSTGPTPQAQPAQSYRPTNRSRGAQQ